MVFNLLEIDISKKADSWVSIFSFNHRSLFYLEWGNEGIEQFDLLFLKIYWHKRYR